MINKGRAVFPSIPYGEKHPCAFISKDTVLAIREMAEKQPLLCQRRIAEKFGVSYQTCNDIIRLRRRKFG
jgi:predicted XRE-type DNA-binding protein